jgi:hypothetical protein
MNRVVTLIALAIALGGPASATIMNTDVKVNTNVVAGQVSASGVVERGTGFRVRLTGFAIYEIKFDRRYFPSGCAAMVVSPNAAVVPVVAQNRCGGVFDVVFYSPKQTIGACRFSVRCKRGCAPGPLTAAPRCASTHDEACTDYTPLV